MGTATTELRTYIRAGGGTSLPNLKENIEVKNLSKVRGISRLSKVALGVGLAGVIGSLALAGSAYAAPNPNPSSRIEVTTQADADALMAQGSISKNIDVPAGSDVQLRWFTVNGNVTVEGHLSMASDVVNGNVTVTGSGSGNIDGSGLTLFNDASHITGNLTVTGSGGYWGGNQYGWTLFDNADGTTQVDGGLALQNNAGGVYISNGGMHVAGKFTDSGNRKYVWPVSTWTTDGLHVSGKTVIS
jgi:hypothetical protein